MKNIYYNKKHFEEGILIGIIFFLPIFAGTLLGDITLGTKNLNLKFLIFYSFFIFAAGFVRYKIFNK